MFIISCNHLLVYSMSKGDRNMGMAKVFCMLFCPQFPLFPSPKLPPREFVLSQCNDSCVGGWSWFPQPHVWLCGLRQNSYLLQYSPLARLHTLAWGGGDPWPSYLVQGCLLPTVPFFPPNKILLSLCQTKSDVQITCVLAHSKSIQGNGKALMGLSWVTGVSNSVFVHCGN